MRNALDGVDAEEFPPPVFREGEAPSEGYEPPAPPEPKDDEEEDDHGNPHDDPSDVITLPSEEPTDWWTESPSDAPTCNGNKCETDDPSIFPEPQSAEDSPEAQFLDRAAPAWASRPTFFAVMGSDLRSWLA